MFKSERTFLTQKDFRIFFDIINDMIVAVNIGYSFMDTQHVLNMSPHIFNVVDFKEFKEIARDSLPIVLSWGVDYHVPLSSLTLCICVQEEDIDLEWNYMIRCENIKGFNPYKDMSIDEFKSFYKGYSRSQKIKGIIGERI